MTEPFDIETKAFKVFEKFRSDPAWMTLGPIQIAHFGRRVWNEAIERAADTATDLAEAEEDRMDSAEGHLRSIAIGAMEAAEQIQKEILALKKEP